jgi:hypothetical protein
MSACNGFVTSTAAYLFTDAAVVDGETFNVKGFINKVAIVPQCGAAVSATGNLMVHSVFASALADTQLNDFDDLISAGPDMVRKSIRQVAALGVKNVFDGFRIGIAGWSPKANAPAFHCIEGDGPSFEMVSCTRFINPSRAHETDQSILGMKFDPRRPAESGLAIMTAQREKKFGPHYGIGGWCQMTTLTRDSIETRVLKQWPDKIGERITPTTLRPAAGSFFR